MDKQLRRILNLVRKTGDRMVVTDANGDDVYVVMGLEQYENLVIPKGNDKVCANDDRLGGGWWNDCGPEEEEEEGRVGPPSVAVATTTPEFSTEAVAKADPSSLRGGETKQVPPPSDIWEVMTSAGSESETWDISKMSDVEKTDLERQFENYQQGKGMAAVEPEKPASSFAKASEDKSEVKDEDFGEEQFYLEPIE